MVVPLSSYCCREIYILLVDMIDASVLILALAAVAIGGITIYVNSASSFEAPLLVGNDSFAVQGLALRATLSSAAVNITAEENSPKLMAGAASPITIKLDETIGKKEETDAKPVLEKKWGIREGPEGCPTGYNTLHCEECGGVCYMRHEGEAACSPRCRGVGIHTLPYVP